MTGAATVTIAVVPRETLSQVRGCLETLVANTESCFRLIVVDACYPKVTKLWLESFARERDATLLRSGCALTPNEARNAALSSVDTKYVVFLDDNCFVRAGCVDALVRCAEETGAAIVGPMCGFRTGRSARETVHVFGAEAHVASDDGHRRLVDRHFHVGMPLEAALDSMSRMTSEAAEFHCMLVRSAIFDELGPLDRGLLSTMEHVDLSMSVRAAGHEVWLEPAAVAVYELPIPLPRRDRAHYVVRWCDAWNRTSCARFAEKWQVAEEKLLAEMEKFAHEHRRLAYRFSVQMLNRVVDKLGNRGWRAVDRLVQALIVSRALRRRSSSRGLTVVHAATWWDPAHQPARDRIA